MLYTHTYTCASTHTHTHMCKYMQIHTCHLYTCTYRHLHSCTHMRTCVFIYMQAHVYTGACIHTCAHTFLWLFSPMRAPLHVGAERPSVGTGAATATTQTTWALPAPQHPPGQCVHHLGAPGTPGSGAHGSSQVAALGTLRQLCRGPWGLVHKAWLSAPVCGTLGRTSLRL